MNFDEANPRDVASSVYINLVAAHEMIVRMRDRLRFVSSVVDSIGTAEADISIRSEVLGSCVSNLVDDLGEVADTVRWSTEACSR